MSWRRFMTLLGGLGPNTTIVTTQASKTPRGRSGKREDVIEFDMHDPAQEDAFLAMLVGPRKRKRKRKQ